MKIKSKKISFLKYKEYNWVKKNNMRIIIKNSVEITIAIVKERIAKIKAIIEALLTEINSEAIGLLDFSGWILSFSLSIISFKI